MPLNQQHRCAHPDKQGSSCNVTLAKLLSDDRSPLERASHLLIYFYHWLRSRNPSYLVFLG